MYLILFMLVVFVLASTSAQDTFDLSRGYHIEIGIPLAERIKAREDALIQEQASRVYNGNSAPLDNYAYFAGLVILVANTTGASVCGASLLSATRLVTAAHCWMDGVSHVSMFTVVLASQYINWGGIRINTTEVYPHPDYDDRKFPYDIAVIYLPQKVKINSEVFPIALPEGKELNFNFTGYTATTVGYGLTEDTDTGVPYKTSRRTTNLQIISNKKCRDALGHSIRDDIICTSGEGPRKPCIGDSGGPLVTYFSDRKILVGVYAFGHAKCGSKFPAAFMRVTYFLDFIKSHVPDLPEFIEFTHIKHGEGRLEFIVIKVMP